MTARTPDPGRAGIVTRLLAAAVDLLAVLGSTVGFYAAAAAAMFLWSPLSFQWPADESLRLSIVGMVLAITYLGVGWATAGRSWGAALLGVRVVGAGCQRLGWARALLRAVLCVVFPIGLLWVAVSAGRRSVQDVLVGSVVIYDRHR